MCVLFFLIIVILAIQYMIVIGNFFDDFYYEKGKEKFLKHCIPFYWIAFVKKITIEKYKEIE